MKWRKKPVVIDALQFHGDNQFEIMRFIEYACPKRAQLNFVGATEDKPQHIQIPTLEGVMEAMPGDYVIVGVKGEVYPCKPDIFTATYDWEPGLRQFMPADRKQSS